MAGLLPGIPQNTATAHVGQALFTIIKAEAAKVPAGVWASTFRLSSQQVVSQPHQSVAPTLSTPWKHHVSEKPDAKDPIPPVLPTGNTQADKETGAGKCYQWTQEFRIACS